MLDTYCLYAEPRSTDTNSPRRAPQPTMRAPRLPGGWSSFEDGLGGAGERRRLLRALRRRSSTPPSGSSSRRCPATTGLRGVRARRSWRRSFELMPDMRATVERLGVVRRDDLHRADDHGHAPRRPRASAGGPATASSCATAVADRTRVLLRPLPHPRRRWRARRGPGRHSRACGSAARCALGNDPRRHDERGHDSPRARSATATRHRRADRARARPARRRRAVAGRGPAPGAGLPRDRARLAARLASELPADAGHRPLALRASPGSSPTSWRRSSSRT